MDSPHKGPVTRKLTMKERGKPLMFISNNVVGTSVYLHQDHQRNDYSWWLEIYVRRFHNKPYMIKHDDVIKWNHFPRYWPFVRGIHWSPVNYPQKGQCRGALMFPLICAWINGWTNNREAGELSRHRAHYDVTVMYSVSGVHSYHRICC